MALADHDVYRTPAGAGRTWFARLSPWPELAFYAPVAWIVWRASRLALRGRYDDDAWVRSSRAILRAMEGVGMQVRIEGMEHLRALGGPAVFVGNHMSTLETFVLPGIIQPVRPVTFVVKQSLLTYPVFGPIMRSRDPIAVGRSNPREDLKAVLEGGQERLARGRSIIVFPQTTRTADFDPSQFNSIGVKLAARAGVPLVPLALRSDAWGNGRRLKDFGRVDPTLPVRFRFGDPLPPEGRETHASVVRFVEGALAEWAGAPKGAG